MLRFVTLSVVVVCLLAPAGGAAYEYVDDSEDAGRTKRSSDVVLPYAFHTELLDTAVGVAYSKFGAFQPQANLFLTGYGTTNDSWGIGGALSRLQLGDSRWFVAPVGFVQRNAQQRFYSELGFGIDETQGGSNDSHVSDFFQGEGWNVFAHAEFRYVAPLGMGRGDPVHHYKTNAGVLQSGGTSGSWNPLKSGRTMFVLKPFYQWRTMVVEDQNIGQFPPFFPVQNGEEVESASNGLKAFVEYDNRDFPLNPGLGSYQRLEVARDFGAFNSSNSWTSVEGEYKKYFNLGTSDRFRQKVLALDAWTAYSPTWDLTRVGNAVRIDNAPPENMGATLGGLYRLRAYPTGRYSDKAAVYYSAELRFIPTWNPIRDWPLIRNFTWRWWQWTGFAEVGRVAPEWDFSELHNNMKWSAGFGFRAMIGSGVARMDIATSEESTQVVLMVGQPF